MKKILFTIILLLIVSYAPAQKTIIRIGTEQTDLLLQVDNGGRLYQTYLGEKLLNDEDLQRFDWVVKGTSDGSAPKRGWEVYSCSGTEDFFEPALNMVHSDGNRTTYLYYKDSEQHSILNGNAIETTIHLADNQYPVNVTLHYIAYQKENVIKTWSEISHTEKTPITLLQYYSTMLYFNAPKYFLTEFSSDWAREGQISSQQLQAGKKIVDTKLGMRANIFTEPFFQVGIGQPVQEKQGTVLMGTIGWVGNWRYMCEIDNAGTLRILPGINPYASDYQLNKSTTFKTPEFIFTLSQHGVGDGSRSLHDWARLYQVKDGMGARMTLLNNWENTYFKFDQEKLSECIREAHDLGVDMFLLDDGWFGNGEYARNGSKSGLGDWEVNREKLPGGIKALTDSTAKYRLKFGLWIEPEMVNPKSELFKKHPDWAIHLPNRKEYYYRNQLVLDLANPKVQDYVFGVIDKLLKDNPEIVYFKWDCNSTLTNIYSPYLKDKQGQMYIDHTRGIENVMRRVSEAYPQIQMMLCSGGGARCDYESLKYFSEFWCSDDTDPVERLYIQWALSQFFPAKTMCAHVTSWNKETSVKFRTDVASMCKLGFDMGLKDMSQDDLAYCKEAIKNWKRLSPVIMDGTQYRLVSPYETNHMAVCYVSAPHNRQNIKELPIGEMEGSHAVLFAYDIHPRYKEKVMNVCMEGLDPTAHYKVVEINLMPGKNSTMKENGKIYTGDYLQKVGLEVFSYKQCVSRVVEIIKQ